MHLVKALAAVEAIVQFTVRGFPPMKMVNRAYVVVRYRQEAFTYHALKGAWFPCEVRNGITYNGITYKGAILRIVIHRTHARQVRPPQSNIHGTATRTPLIRAGSCSG